jgi:hypothetical protein
MHVQEGSGGNDNHLCLETPRYTEEAAAPGWRLITLPAAAFWAPVRAALLGPLCSACSPHAIQALLSQRCDVWDMVEISAKVFDASHLVHPPCKVHPVHRPHPGRASKGSAHDQCGWVKGPLCRRCLCPALFPRGPHPLLPAVDSPCCLRPAWPPSVGTCPSELHSPRGKSHLKALWGGPGCRVGRHKRLLQARSLEGCVVRDLGAAVDAAETGRSAPAAERLLLAWRGGRSAGHAGASSAGS